jgi:NDP-sugar pyrophosphorylase family protein/mannose-6-phosphate isomerase-like protein (cupin superfamily)
MVMKTVYKPWGKEVWLELNNFYCYKRIYINSGHKTSFQYHNEKYETNYIISGTAEVWLEDDNGIVQKTIMSEGDFFNVSPPKKHRVIALTDLILQEVSTPHVDDVIRIEDDTNRPDGKILSEHQPPAVLILAAGLGSRLQTLSKNINKVLLPISNKAVISHIIDKFSNEHEIIIAIGYKGDTLQEYCNIAHSDRNITFVSVDDYTGIGSGPGYSALKCKQLLQRPFYFITGDCLLENSPPPLTENWIGVMPTEFPEKYSTVKVENNRVIDFKNKSSDGFDHAFIGVAGIVDYEIFWEQLEKNIYNTGEIVSTFQNINAYPSLKACVLSWFDTGNLDDLYKAKKYFKDNPLSLNKVIGEITYKVNGKFIKYFPDEKKVMKLKQRYHKLKELTPTNVVFSKNFLSYDWIEGDTLYNLNNLDVMENFTKFLQLQIENSNVKTSFSDVHKFYEEKTKNRIHSFLEKYGKKYYTTSHKINGHHYPSMEVLFNKIDFSILKNNPLYEKFHGDLQFDNVIYSNGKFFYIDWREEFGENVEVGDVYYDISKLLGGIMIPYHNMKNENNISVIHNDDTVSYSYQVPETLKKLLPIYNRWIIDNNFDISKINLITALIYLNMAPLHDEKFSKMLWFKSIEMLYDYQAHN